MADWADLTTAEPRLGVLLFDAQAAHDPGGPWFCRLIVWQREFKPRLMELVGFNRLNGPAWMQTAAAYQTAYRVVHDALPECRNDGCAAGRL